MREVLLRLAVISHACFRAVNRRVHVALCERGVDILIIAPERLGGDLADPQCADDPFIRFLPLTSENPRTYSFKGMSDVLAKYRPNLIMLEADPVSRLAVSLGSWSRRHGAKLTCLSVDNLDFGFLPHLSRTGLASLPKIIAKTLLHWAARPLVDIVFTVSGDGTALFQNRGYRKVVQVPLGFDPSLFHIDHAARTRVRSRLGIDADTTVLGYFGRVVQEKGVHLIINALKQVAGRHPDLRSWCFLLDHFQADRYTQEIDDLIEQSGLGSRVVRFEANHNQIAEYMCATDVVLLVSLSTPTSKEQYGRVIPEAMACGALAVVSDCGTPKELVGDCGLVLPEGDDDKLAAVLTDIISTPEKFVAMRALGAKRATVQFSVPRQADTYFDSLLEVTSTVL